MTQAMQQPAFTFNLNKTVTFQFDDFSCFLLACGPVGATLTSTLASSLSSTRVSRGLFHALLVFLSSSTTFSLQLHCEFSSFVWHLLVVALLKFSS